jgi:basic membrane lipoprotein Med (substrate-binding protein (PBP1-ABC) superfamily)
MNARSIAVATAITFAAGVFGLLTFGRGLMNKLDDADTTVCYLDLARQASDKRDYAQAQSLYEAALSFARNHDHNRQMQKAVLDSYLKFAVRKKEDRQLAAAIQTRIDALQR